MKKTILTLLILIVIFFIIISMLFIYTKNIQKTGRDVLKFNQEYEQYLDKEILGTELATIINKAIDNNEKYEIRKSSKGLYLEDNKYCLKIIVKFLDSDNYYQMEVINSLGINNFISNFNLAKFKCTETKYNELTNRVSKLVFEETKHKEI